MTILYLLDEHRHRLKKPAGFVVPITEHDTAVRLVTQRSFKLDTIYQTTHAQKWEFCWLESIRPQVELLSAALKRTGASLRPHQMIMWVKNFPLASRQRMYGR